METAEYEFNPATDEIISGYVLKEDFSVMPEDPFSRRYGSWGRGKDERSQQFARVTKLRNHQGTLSFVGVWPDGYQQVVQFHESRYWILNKRKARSNDTADRAHLGDKPWMKRYIFETDQFVRRYSVRDFGYSQPARIKEFDYRGVSAV